MAFSRRLPAPAIWHRRGVQPSAPCGGDVVQPWRPAVGSLRRQCGAEVGATITSRSSSPSTDARRRVCGSGGWRAASTSRPRLRRREEDGDRRHTTTYSGDTSLFVVVNCGDGIFAAGVDCDDGFFAAGVDCGGEFFAKV